MGRSSALFVPCARRPIDGVPLVDGSSGSLFANRASVFRAAPLPNGGLGEEEVEEVLRMRQTPDMYKRLAER